MLRNARHASLVWMEWQRRNNMSEFMDTQQIVHHGDLTDHFENGEHVSAGFKGAFHSHEYFARSTP